MKVIYIHKYNCQKLHKPLHPCYEEILRLCMDDLSANGFTGNVHLILQTGKSQSQSKWYGLCDYFAQPMPKVYIYTYRHRVMTNVNTIAHEFGHISHYVTLPHSRYWNSRLQEQYANQYAALMLQHFHFNRTKRKLAA